MSKNIDKLESCFRRTRKKWLKEISQFREMTLANLAMISQTPGMTFQESERSKLLVDRFCEGGVSEATTDKLHNAIAKLERESPRRTILVFTHMDNQFDQSVDQNISIDENRVHGVGVADDNIALAVLLTLPDIFRKLELGLNSDVVFLATTRFHARGDFGGIRHFIDEYDGEIAAAVNLSGLSLGVIDYFTLSRARCEIRCELDVGQDTAWMKTTNDSSIMVLNDIINGMLAIPLPRKPKTIINIGMIAGGERYSTVSREATANLEVLSEDDDIMETVVENIKDQCADIGAKHGARVTTDFFGRHQASGLGTNHPLKKIALSVIKGLGVNPSIEYTNSEIAVPLGKGIPSVSLGITTGRGGASPKSHVDIEPINDGILQVAQVIHAIDKEYGSNG